MRTFGFVVLALQASGAPESGTGIDFVQLIANSTWLAKSVLLLLLIFSAISWGIILLKSVQLAAANIDTITLTMK